MEGQATDFNNEFDSEYEVEVDEGVASVNNNASILDPRNSQLMDEVRIKPIDKEATRKSNEVEMQKFIDFMRKQGLIIIDTSKQGNNVQQPWNQGKGQDDQDHPWTQVMRMNIIMFQQPELVDHTLIMSIILFQRTRSKLDKEL